MPSGDIAAGQRQSWSLVKKLGEGDAGEVFLVESLLERKQAILKRPHRSAFSSDILRQANQIKTEGKILKVLENCLPSAGEQSIRAPSLLDVSPPSYDYGENLFIIIEKAPGFDLKILAKAAHFSRLEDIDNAEPFYMGQKLFLDRLVEKGEIPVLILLRALSGTLKLFERIHHLEGNEDGVNFAGVIWNDVKPEHLFWDPEGCALTVIDWGNGQFLDREGKSRDMRFTREADFEQYFDEWGRFLQENSPTLHERLNWPSNYSGSIESELEDFKGNLFRTIAEEESSLRNARRREGDLVSVTKPTTSHLDKLKKVQKQIIDFGELPKFDSAEKLYARLAVKFASDKSQEKILQVCEEACLFPGAEVEKWELIRQLVKTAIQEGDGWEDALFKVVEKGVQGEWPEAFWGILENAPEGPLPTWWDEVSQKIRRLHLNIDPYLMPPYVVVTRLFYTLQAALFKLGDVQGKSNGSGKEVVEESTENDLLYRYEILVRTLDEELIKKWKDPEPAPPNSGIQYRDVDQFIEDIESLQPGAKNSLEKALTQARSQADLVMDAWQRKEFEGARRGLRQLLLWDTHRRRLLLADRAMQSASSWLLKIRQGVRSEESLVEYLTSMELAGRELRNQVGPAGWLDSLLTAFKQLRNGSRPADLLMERPELSVEIPWFNEYRSRETLSLPRMKPIALERETYNPLPLTISRKGHEGRLGLEQDMVLADPLDSWAPEARGSSARVFLGYLRKQDGELGQFAVKVMRPGRGEYALPLFREEVQILSILRDAPGVVRMAECGFLLLDEGMEIPSDERRASATGLSGELERFGFEEVQNYLAVLDTRVGQGWLPYLILEKLNNDHNLMIFCDAGYTRGRFLPLHEGLLLAIQILDILQVAHDRNISYLDHKILHYYWDVPNNSVCLLDWNVSKRYPHGMTDAEKKFDLVQFAARALHHIMTGRPAPGSLPLGPNRPEEIEQASHSYQTIWTYDDERLPNRLKEILEASLSETYLHARDLRQDLLDIYTQIPDTAPLISE
jgi:serine/threonine protein kinase